MNENLGQTEFFDGAMTATVTRNTLKIVVLETAVFETLEMMYPGDHAEAADPADITFPALTELYHVKSFKLDSGSIQAIYYAS